MGRNYSEHINELKNETPKEPLIFLKSGDCLVRGSEIHLPNWSKEVHHELEVAFQFDKHLQLESVALALDLTERDLQTKLKAKGQPWTLAKSFTGACPITESKKISDLGGLNKLIDLEFSLTVNDELRQKGKLSQMIFNLDTLSTFVKTHFPVQPGDWLLTGTPAGVAAMKCSDNLSATWGPINHNWRVF